MGERPAQWDPVSAFRLDERVAVVTGASSGLGVVFAETVAAAGAKVVVAARRRERLEELAARLEERGAECQVIACDVTVEADVDRLVADTLDRFGRLDVLVNNAGMAQPQPAESESLDDFRRVIDVNLTGVFLCAQRCARPMLEAGRGSIVNVASVLGLVGAGQIPQASYTASKGGVVNMTRELAAQWARRGIRVNAIAPGWFRSEMTEEMFADEGGQRFIRRRTPMGRAGEGHELAGALLFLASDASSYTTGQTIAVDGGWTVV
jgi:NAD(P)-dependent dehydrogenase (short-subunit alcohol dehydrogenase family)